MRRLASFLGISILDTITIWSAFQAPYVWIKGLAIAATVLLTGAGLWRAKPFAAVCTNVVSAGWRQMRHGNAGLFLIVEDFRILLNTNEAMAQWRVISSRFQDTPVDRIKLSITFTGASENLEFSPDRSFIIRNFSETPMYSHRAKLPSSWHEPIKDGQVRKYFGTLTSFRSGRLCSQIEQEFWAKLT